MTRTFPFLLFLILLQFACKHKGEPFARISVTEISIDSLSLVEQVIHMKKGDKVAVWTDMDVEYKGELGLRFKIQMQLDGVDYAGIEIDPYRESKQNESSKIKLVGSTRWQYRSRQKGFTVDKTGDYVFKVLLAGMANNRPKINKADIILKR